MYPDEPAFLIERQFREKYPELEKELLNIQKSEPVRPRKKHRADEEITMRQYERMAAVAAYNNILANHLQKSVHDKQPVLKKFYFEMNIDAQFTKLSQLFAAFEYNYALNHIKRVVKLRSPYENRAEHLLEHVPPTKIRSLKQLKRHITICTIPCTILMMAFILMTLSGGEYFTSKVEPSVFFTFFFVYAVVSAAALFLLMHVVDKLRLLKKLRTPYLKKLCLIVNHNPQTYPYLEKVFQEDRPLCRNDWHNLNADDQLEIIKQFKFKQTLAQGHENAKV